MNLQEFKRLLFTVNNDELIQLLKTHPELAYEFGESEEVLINEILELDYDIEKMTDTWNK